MIVCTHQTSARARLCRACMLLNNSLKARKKANERLLKAVAEIASEGLSFTMIDAAHRMKVHPTSVGKWVDAAAEDGLIEVFGEVGRPKVIRIVASGLTTAEHDLLPQPVRQGKKTSEARIAALRTRLLKWFTLNEWSMNQFMTGMGAVTGTMLAHATISQFCKGERIGVEAMQAIARFISDNPKVAPFDTWRDTITRNAQRKEQDQRDGLMARIAAVERQREEHRRALLAAERAPKKRTRDFWDAATVRALSGGTMAGGIGA